MRAAFFALGCFLSLLLATPNSRGESPADRNARVEKILPTLQRTASRYRAICNSPGLAIVVATPDRLYFINSGRRRVNNRSTARVNESTSFQVASVSKPITGTYAARLVTEGRLDWDDRIVDLLPWFRFQSESVTQKVTVLDMLTQRSGLKGGTGNILEDLGWGQRFVLEKMRYIDPSPGFRKTWDYVNFGITLGGVAAAKTTPWEFPESIRKILFEPLEMERATARYTTFRTQQNRGQMNYVLDGRPGPWFVRDAQAQAPGGGISMSSADLGVLLQLYLNDGVFKGRQFLSQRALRFVTSPLTYVTTLKDGTRRYYGVGWDVWLPRNGPRTISHTGAFAGMRTIVSFRPDEKIGIAVLSNSFIGLPPDAIEDAFYQLYGTGRVRPDTLSKWRAQLPQSAMATIDQLLQTPKTLGPIVKGQPRAAYVGRYANAFLGYFEIIDAGDGLRLHVGPNEPPLPVQWNPADGELWVLNRSGDTFKLIFQHLTNGKFSTLRVPEADQYGWGTLTRVE